MIIRTLNLGIIQRDAGAGSLVRIGHEPPKNKNIVLDWQGFKGYVSKKYAGEWARACYRYARKHFHLIENPSLLETFSKAKKNNILKALIALSKYHGFHLQFKERIKDYGIKWSRSTSIDAFFRIIRTQDNDVLEWYNDVIEILDDDSAAYLRFVLMTGMRRTEALNSFNLVLSLHSNGKIGEYYNDELKTLEHFRFKDMFLRNTKNVFISIIPKTFLEKIAQHSAVTYDMVRKKLQRRHKRTRINELRDYYGTFMVRHGLIREEVDLLQGRIPSQVFVRHYWSPSFEEMQKRVFKALQKLEDGLT